MISLGSDTFLSTCAGDGMPLSTKQHWAMYRIDPDVA
jgi:hypothetical protein